jgi:hypothetical protein
MAKHGACRDFGLEECRAGKTQTEIGMSGHGARIRRAGFCFVASLTLGACAGHSLGLGGTDGDDGGTQTYPDDYEAQILAAMHAYLNDPTGIRDAAIAQPALKEVSVGTRYVVCLRFNGKRDDGSYAGVKQIAAVFRAGRFEDFVDAPREPCLNAYYQSFPKLGNLKP